MERRNQSLLSPFSPPMPLIHPCKNRNKRITDGWKREFSGFFAQRYRKISFHWAFSRVCDRRGGWALLIITLEKGYSCFSCRGWSSSHGTTEERCDSIWRKCRTIFFFFNSILEEKIEFYSTYFSRFHPWRMVFVIIVRSTERRKGGMILRKEK